MSEKEKNDYIRNFVQKLEFERKDCVCSMQASLKNVIYQEGRLKQVNEALKRLEVEEPDDESEDKVLEAAEEYFEGQRERFE